MLFVCFLCDAASARSIKGSDEAVTGHTSVPEDRTDGAPIQFIATAPVISTSITATVRPPTRSRVHRHNRSLARLPRNSPRRRIVSDVRLSPNSGAKADIAGGPKGAISGLRRSLTRGPLHVNERISPARQAMPLATADPCTESLSYGAAENRLANVESSAAFKSEAAK